MKFGKTCAIILNEELELTEQLKKRIEYYIEGLIAFGKVWGFTLGKMTNASRYCLEVLERLRNKKYGHIYMIYCPCVGEANAIETIRFQYIDQTLFLDRSPSCAVNRDTHMIIQSDFYLLHCIDESKLLQEGKYIFSESQRDNIINIAK